MTSIDQPDFYILLFRFILFFFDSIVEIDYWSAGRLGVLYIHSVNLLYYPRIGTQFALDCADMVLGQGLGLIWFCLWAIFNCILMVHLPLILCMA